jgi:sugar lactone lactonase YvrE
MRIWSLYALALCTACAASAAAATGDFKSLVTEMTAAYKAHDYAAMQTATRELLAQHPGYPRMIYYLAVAENLSGDPAEALTTLSQLADMGLYFDLAKDKDFAALQGTPGFTALQARFAANLKPVVHSAPAFRLPQRDFIPEGLAYDAASGDFFVASVHKRSIARVHAGKADVFAAPAQDIWSVLGLRVDAAHNALWAVTSALPETEGYDPKLKGRTALLRFGLKNGVLEARYAPPEDGVEHELNDLFVAPDGSVYAADGAGGVYVLAAGTRELKALTPAGALRSSQGMTLSADGRYLYIADYGGGLYAYELMGHRLLPVTAPPNVCTYGVDGLYRHGRDLIATQNGIEPARVVRYRLDDSGLAIQAAEVLEAANPAFQEPTLGVLVDDTFYFVANSQWNRFDEQGQLPSTEQLQEPLILALPLH